MIPFSLFFQRMIRLWLLHFISSPFLFSQLSFHCYCCFYYRILLLLQQPDIFCITVIFAQKKESISSFLEKTTFLFLFYMFSLNFFRYFVGDILYFLLNCRAKYSGSVMPTLIATSPIGISIYLRNSIARSRRYSER